MEVNLNIESTDISFLKDFLKGRQSPVEIEELTNQLALFKTRKRLEDRVKIYDPRCEYKANDLIYKDYIGKVPVGAKKYIELEKGVVLKVVEVRSRFKEEIKLEYEGTSDYKKYIDYLNRQKIELLLPHKMSKPCIKHEYVDPEDDPRRYYDPLLEKDFNNLKKKLAALLNKDPDIAFSGNKAILAENLKQIDSEVFTKIREFLTDNGKSGSTEFFVENFARIKPDNEEFDAYCFALNYKMKTDYKIDFQQVSREGWGKWNLISVIYYLQKDSIISDENPYLKNISVPNRKGSASLRKKFEEKLYDDDTSKYFLTQREIHAGAIRLKPGLYDVFESIEVELVDENTKKSYTGYLYGEADLLLGLKDVYDHYKVLQGSIISLSQVKDTVFFFNIRTTKKGTVSEKIEYDREEKVFRVKEDKIASQVFINKSIYLEQKDLIELEHRIDFFRSSNSFNELLNKVFIEFGVKERNYEIHLLKLYHILDLIAPVSLRTILEATLENPSFIPSEKVHGVLYLDPNAIGDLVREETKQKESHETHTRTEQSAERMQQIIEEKKVDEEIRLIREERKRKREAEMHKVEQMEKERLEKSKKEQKTVKISAQSEVPVTGPTEMVTSGAEGESPSKAERAKKEAGHKKKLEKDIMKSDKDKASVKKSKKTEADDKLDLEDIQSEIQLLKLKEKVEREKAKKIDKEKAKEIAFEDTSGFGGTLASKLEEITKSEKKDKKNKKEKK